jgi:hypothetical protein
MGGMNDPRVDSIDILNIMDHEDEVQSKPNFLKVDEQYNTIIQPQIKLFIN